MYPDLREYFVKSACRKSLFATCMFCRGGSNNIQQLFTISLPFVHNSLEKRGYDRNVNSTTLQISPSLFFHAEPAASPAAGFVCFGGGHWQTRNRASHQRLPLRGAGVRSTTERCDCSSLWGGLARIAAACNTSPSGLRPATSPQGEAFFAARAEPVCGRRKSCGNRHCPTGGHKGRPYSHACGFASLARRGCFRYNGTTTTIGGHSLGQALF